MDEPKKKLGFLSGLLLVIMLLFCMIPLILMLVDSFKSTGDLMTLDFNVHARLSLAQLRVRVCGNGFF